MDVLVCPTAFKESMSAPAAAASIAAGIGEALPEARITELPVSDGGPGLLDAVRATEGGEVETLDVSGPLLGRAQGRLLWLPGGETAVIESADACGLHLMPPGARAPLSADTRGVGELVRHAVDEGAARVILGLGGSGTVDGGSGLARAFGYRFLDDRGREIAPGGGPLRRLARIEGGAPPDAGVLALADVRIPLTGPRGAARVFAPQKGAREREVEALEEGLERLAGRIESDLGRRVADVPGGGAAGGLGAGCVAFLDAELVEGAGWLLSRAGFPERLEAAELVVTGEGAFDETSGEGKVTGEVIRRAGAIGRPVLLLCGRVEAEVPEHVRAADADGEWLDRDSLAALARREAERLPG